MGTFGGICYTQAGNARAPAQLSRDCGWAVGSGWRFGKQGMLTSKLRRSIASLETFDCRVIKVGEGNVRIAFRMFAFFVSLLFLHIFPDFFYAADAVVCLSG